MEEKLFVVLYHMIYDIDPTYMINRVKEALYEIEN